VTTSGNGDDPTTGGVEANGDGEYRPPAAQLRQAGPGRSIGMPTEKSKDMGAAVRRLLGRMAPERPRLIAVGTLAVTALGVALATPLGLGTAIYLTEYTAEGRMTRVIRFGADCLAGVPSIIFGLFGFVFFVITLGFGWSILAGGLTLAFMILPTIIRTSEEAIRAVPRQHREVALSLGASKWESIYKVVVPTGLPGIVTGIILGVGRSISETAAVIFTAGSSLSHVIPTSVFDGTRTLSVHFYQLAREGISAEKAYATASVLVVAILAINVTAYALMERFMKRFR
jgi:phosphate transport system permease protein